MRAGAHALALSVSATEWHGIAADTFCLGADGTLAALRSASVRLDDAAAALRAHAQTVRHVVATLHSLVAHAASGRSRP